MYMLDKETFQTLVTVLVQQDARLRILEKPSTKKDISKKNLEQLYSHANLQWLMDKVMLNDQFVE